MRRSLLSSVFLTALLLVTACGGGDATAPETVYGRYELRTVDTKPVPALNYVEGAYTFEVMSGFYEIHPDGAFNTATTYREKYLGWMHVSTHSFEGTYTVSGDTISFAWTGGDSAWTGVLHGGELTVNDHGRVSVFRK